MCFRPTQADSSAICPECGKKVNAIMGNLPLKCPFCKTDFSELINAMEDGDSGAPAAPAAPGAPAAPAAPAAPKPPTA